MTDIISKLVTDLKWRFSGAGKKFKPKPKELKSWGAMQVPRVVPWLIWLAYLLFATVGSQDMGWMQPSDFPGIIVGGPVGLVWVGLLVSFLTRKANRTFALNAYKELLETKERFTLVEYSRYLQRQIKRASEDSTLGGVTEMRRLQEIDKKLRKLLRDGAGEQGQAISSELSDEAELAQAVVDTYGELAIDPMERLDSRLPGELLASIEELDREEERAVESTKGKTLE